MYTVHSNTIYPWFLLKTKPKLVLMTIVLYKWSVKLRLHTAINRADFVSWYMLYTYEGNKVAFVNKWRCTFVAEPLNHIHEDTKSARLIAMYKWSFSKCTQKGTVPYLFISPKHTLSPKHASRTVTDDSSSINFSRTFNMSAMLNWAEKKRKYFTKINYCV